MSETTATPGQAPEPITPVVTEPKKQEPKTDDPAVLKAELASARKEAAKYRTQAREAAEAKKKAEETALAEQGKHKELAEARAKELDALKPELETLRAAKAQQEAQEAAARAEREAKVRAEFSQLPEAARAGIPADADARSMEIALAAYRAGTGAKPPAVAPTAPAPASGPVGKPPKPTNEEMQRAAATRDPKVKHEIQTKVAAWSAWVKQHPEDA